MKQVNTTILERTYDLHHDELVIGASLSALVYAYVRKVPFIYLEPLKPNRFEKVGDVHMREVWDRIYISLSILGHNMFTNTLGHIDVQEDRVIARTKSGEEYNITYNKLKVFDSWNVTGLDFKDTDLSNVQYEVFDYFRTSLGRNEIVTIKETTDNTFVQEIRLCQMHADGYYRRVLAISTLNAEEVFDPNYNQTCARIKAKRMMKKARIQGRTSKQTRTLSKRDENGNKYNEVSYYTYVRPVDLKAHVRCIRRMNCLEVNNTDKIIFMKETPFEIFTNYRMIIRSRFGEMVRMLYGRTNRTRAGNRDEEWPDTI